MAIVNCEANGEFQVRFIRTTVVKAVGAVPEHHVLTLSNLDLLSGRFPVTYFYFYSREQKNQHNSEAEGLESSLSETLSHFYPFAGRIVQNPFSNEPEIICDNTGALFVEAETNISLKELNFYNLSQILQGKLVTIHNEFPLQIQFTHYTCGGISLSVTFDHSLGDASSFGNFLRTWSEVTSQKPLSCSPDHRRYLSPRFPLSYDPSLDRAFISCTLEDILNMPAPRILLKRLYYIDASNIDRLQKLASCNGAKRTKIEAFSAYVWKIMVNSIDKNHKECKMGWLVDGRTRICKDQNSMCNYIGNVLSLAFGEASVNELRQGTLTDIAKVVHEAISKVTNEKHFRDLIDWIEYHRPGLILSKVVLGQGGPALVISSGRRFPVSEIDFGFGSPILGTVCSTIEKIGVGYLNQRPSASRDGSWTVSAILWPEMVEALESDPNHVFQPMNAKHLWL